MNIYIKMEVFAREIEGRLLLALAAAERGHTVLLGDFRRLLAHRLWLPPGVFHDKSLTPSRSKTRQFQRLVDAGFVVTSQDEEHGLLQPDYTEHTRLRFSEETLALAHRSFMWGPHDAAGLRNAYPQHADRIVEVGSPRADLWRPEAAPFYDGAPIEGVDPSRPLVLLVAYGHSALNVNRIWVEIDNQRGTYLQGPDDPREWDHYRQHADDTEALGAYVRMVRAAVRAHPEVQFVLRPHPTTADGAWEMAVGDHANLSVRRDGAVGRWVRRATVVVHSASTVGFEAALAQVSLISFSADGRGPRLLSDELGVPGRGVDETVALIGQAVGGELATGPTPEQEALLAARFAARTGRLASDRIVDEWEALGAALAGAPDASAGRGHILSEAHHRVGAVRTRITGRTKPGRFRMEHKFPPLDRAEVRRLIAAHQRTFGRFDGVEVAFHGPSLLSLRAS